MRESFALLTEEAGDLLLVASLLTVGPSWVGAIEFLSALGLDGGAVAFLSGTYAWGRGIASAVLLIRHARRGTLSFGGAWLSELFEQLGAHAPVSTAYPMPATGEFTFPSATHAC